MFAFNPFLGMFPLMMMMPGSVATRVVKTHKKKRRVRQPQPQSESASIGDHSQTVGDVNSLIVPTEHGNVSVITNDAVGDVVDAVDAPSQRPPGEIESEDPEILSKLSEACHRKLDDFLQWSSFPLTSRLGVMKIVQ
jgi:hypothetical protein